MAADNPCHPLVNLARDSWSFLPNPSTGVATSYSTYYLFPYGSAQSTRACTRIPYGGNALLLTRLSLSALMLLLLTLEYIRFSFESASRESIRIKALGLTRAYGSDPIGQTCVSDVTLPD